MVNYRSYVMGVIRRGNYVLSDMEGRINKLWVEGKLTDADRDELIQMAADGARDELQVDVMEKIADLEHRVWELEHPVDQFAVWTAGYQTQKGETVRFDVTGDGEYDLCRYDGGRASTALSIGKIDGWVMLDRELNVIATITRDADGGYVVTYLAPEEPEVEPEPTDDEPTEE